MRQESEKIITFTGLLLIAVYAAFFCAISAVIEFDRDFGWLSLGLVHVYHQRALLITAPTIAAAALAIWMHFEKRWLGGVVMIVFGLAWVVNYVVYFSIRIARPSDSPIMDEIWALIILFVIPNSIICWAGVLEIVADRRSRLRRLSRRYASRRTQG